jgi:hypothetical protein
VFGACNGTHLRYVIRYLHNPYARPGGYFSHVNISFDSIIHLSVGKLHVSPRFRVDDKISDYPSLTVIIAHPPTCEHGVIRNAEMKGFLCFEGLFSF